MSTNSIGEYYPPWWIPTTSPTTVPLPPLPPPVPPIYSDGWDQLSPFTIPSEVTYSQLHLDYSSIIGQLMARLAEFYGLPKETQGLIMALLKEPKDKDLLAVFADWLEENNRKEADKVREAAKK